MRKEPDFDNPDSPADQEDERTQGYRRNYYTA
jgi:hypothetical protein